MHLKISSEKWRPFCIDLNVLMSELSFVFTEGGDIGPTGSSVTTAFPTPPDYIEYPSKYFVCKYTP